MAAIDLSGFTGSETFFRHPLMRNVVFTEGVNYLAEQANAFWLIDAIASWQLEPKVNREEFQVWKLIRDAEGNGANLICEDGNDNVLQRQRIEYTDFPMPEITLWYTNNTILLPSEY